MELNIPLEKMERYRQTARERQQREREKMEQRRDTAWVLAKQAADLLKNQFGATQVVVFGSLARGQLPHAHSDIDLAAWGIDPSKYFRAVSHLLSLDPKFSFDLVPMEEASESIRSAIQREGVLL